MKKVISILLVLALMATSVLTIVGCGFGDDDPTSCTTHTDANYDRICDVCGDTLHCVHADNDSDGQCDICGTDMSTAQVVTNFEVPTAGYDGSEVTITFYTTMGASKTAILEAYIADFNELYPNITVVHSTYGDYDAVRSQISTELVANAQPNLAYCYPDHVALYNLAGAVVQIDSLINSTITVTHADNSTEILGLTAEQVDDFIDAYYEEGRQFGDNLMYSLPFSKSTEVLYYNKTFFDENNLDVPTTWEEMETLCAAIKALEPDSIPLGYDSEANWFITMCEQYGSDYTSATAPHYLFDNETNRDFVKMFREWYELGYVTTQSLYGAYTSGLFTAEGSYMSIGSSAGATYQRPTKGADSTYPFEVGIAPIPQVDPEDPKVISQGPSVCIFKSADPQEVVASWLLLKFLTTSVEFQAEFSIDSGYVPVLESVSENAIYSAHLAAADGGDGIAALSAKVCMEQKDAYYTSPAFHGSSKAREEVGILLATALSGAAGSNVDSYIKGLFEDAIEECEY